MSMSPTIRSNNIDPTGQFLGAASKLVNLIIKGGDIGATLAGAAADTRTLFSGDATLGQRALAAVSLASEIGSPVSLREKGYVDVVRQDDGSYSLKRFIRKLDSEEDREYIVRELPDPVGRFADLSSAIDEAKRLVGVCA